VAVVVDVVVVVIVVVCEVLRDVEDDDVCKGGISLKHLQTGNPSTLEHSLPVK
jgi:hypothetical protein